MLPFELSQTDIDTIKIERNSHICSRVRTRLWTLWFLHKGFNRQVAADLAGCTPNSVTNILRTFNLGGLQAIMAPMQTKKGRHSLHKKFKKVRRSLIKAGIHTIKQAQAHLDEKFGYKANWESVRELLHRLGLSRRKINPFPGNPKKFKEWRKAQKKWIKHLQTLHKQALAKDIDFVFADAAHFVHGKFGAYLWSDGPRYKSTGSGRYRLNVYGAYDPISNQLLSQYGEGTVDAEYVVDFLKWLRENHYPDLNRPLHFVLDNARYQHCAYVRQEAAKLGIVLEFQPSYSPNLNLIERAWKYFKKLVGRCYYSTKEEFFAAIISILDKTDETQHQECFTTLLTMNFQTYKKSQILGG